MKIYIDACTTGIGIWCLSLGWGYTLPIKKCSNNEAEWRALIEVLRIINLANFLKGEKISIYTDSQLVVKQFNMVWQVKKDHLKFYYWRCRQLFEGLKYRGISIKVKHIKGSENKEADRLSRIKP